MESREGACDAVGRVPLEGQARIVDDADELADRVTRRDSALLATADELAEASRRAVSGGLD